MNKQIKISEAELTIVLCQHLKDCDLDELGVFAGLLLGGKCYLDTDWRFSDILVFEPNENYFNALKKWEGKKND